MNKHSYTRALMLYFMLGLSSVMAQSGMTTPGGTSYDTMDGNILYSENWTFPAYDEGYVIFDIAADNSDGNNEVGIAFSDTPDPDLYIFNITLGAWGNAVALLDTTDANGETVIDYNKKPPVSLSPAPQPFWISMDHGIITMGRGRTINQDIMQTWNLNDYAPDSSDLGISYFTFSALRAGYITNIEFGPIRAPEPEVEPETTPEVTPEETPTITPPGDIATTTMVPGKRTPTYGRAYVKKQRKMRRKLMKSRSRKAPIGKSTALQLRARRGQPAAPYQAPQRQMGRQIAPRPPMRMQQPTGMSEKAATAVQQKEAIAR